MGVRGLTTFIANRSRQYLERYELHDCYLVLDGNSIASQLYKWHCKCNDCFGGDYDKYAHIINTFFQLLRDCNVTPFVVFDGAYETRKLKTVYSRMKNKISAARDLNSVTEGRVVVFPLFLRELFVDILLKLQIQCVRCDFEGDSEMANLAKNLQCPILSYDSDFYIFDVLYIPFSTMELRVRKKKNVNYILCEMYNVDKFLQSFGGLDKINLPLLAVLLGNDYITKSSFSRFFQHLKMQKTKENEQQKLIKSIIIWLKNETPESALIKILGRYKLNNRKRLTNKIKLAIQGYQSTNSDIYSYFNIDLMNKDNTHVINIPNPEEIENVDDENETEEALASSEDSSEEELASEIAKPVDDTLFSTDKIFFHENFRKCLYPPCFMDMMVSNTYYCIPQVEDFSSEHSHTISLEIVRAIHKILISPEEKNLVCVARNKPSGIKKTCLPFYEKQVPTLPEIESCNLDMSKKCLLNILDLKDLKFLDLFPSSWHLYLISLKYWISNSKMDRSYVYSAILCAILINYVDEKIGFYRSTKSFLTKYSNYPTSDVSIQACSENITELLNKINKDESVSCMRKLIDYFQMEAKMKSTIRLFDRAIVHNFAQFQSCILHIKYLNALLKFPFTPTIISDFYDGTFLYNMTTNLMKRTNLTSYIKILLDVTPNISHVLEMMVEQICTEIDFDFKQSVIPKRKRRRNKKNKIISFCSDELEMANDESDEEYQDLNNVYSLLSFVNK